MSPPKNFISAFLYGFFYHLKSLNFLRKEKLLKFAIIPIIINILIITILFYSAFYFGGDYLLEASSWVNTKGDGAWYGKIFDVLGFLFKWLLYLLVIVTMGFIGLIIGRNCAGPFLDILSMKIETKVLGNALGEQKFTEGMSIAIKDVFWSLVMLFFISLPLLVFSLFLPILVVLKGLIESVFLGHEFFSIPLARLNISYRKRFQFIKDNKGLVLGFGFSTLLLLMIPIINLILLPVISSSATLIFCELLKDNRIKIDGKVM